MFSSSQNVTFQKACKREGPWRFRQAKREAKRVMFKKHVNVKLREATVKGPVKGFWCELNLVDLVELKRAADSRNNLVEIREGYVKPTWRI